ncbi:MAG TPA: hypothetical protein VGM87_07050 [Roseomonas sp.]|jgi:hypothetical protein
MNGEDLKRRVVQQRAEARMQSKLHEVERHRPDGKPATGADCAQAAKDPGRRLEPLRRQAG